MIYTNLVLQYYYCHSILTERIDAEIMLILVESFIDILADLDRFSGVLVRHKYDSHRCIPHNQTVMSPKFTSKKLQVLFQNVRLILAYIN